MRPHLWWLVLLAGLATMPVSARTHINDVLAKGSEWTLNVDGKSGTLKLLGGSGGLTDDGGFELNMDVDWNGNPGTLHGVMDSKNTEQRVELRLTRDGFKVLCKGFVARNADQFMAGITSYGARPETFQGAWYATRPVKEAPRDPRIISFEASPGSIRPGDESQLSWKVENAETVEISPNVGRVRSSGRHPVTPAQTTAYTLVARSASGAAKRQVRVRVEPGAGTAPPTESFAISALRPKSPATRKAGEDSLSVSLRYSLRQSATLQVIPLDASKRPVQSVAWQAGGTGENWSGKVGSSIDMPVRPGRGDIQLQLKPMEPAEVKFLRLHAVRGGAVALRDIVEVAYRFERGATGNVSISGRITGQTRYVKEVALYSEDLRTQIATARVSGNRYQFRNLPAGTYVVVPLSGGKFDLVVEPQRKKLKCRANESFSANFHVKGIREG